MILRPSVLCPIDFSESSRGALRYARAIAAHFAARLTVIAVDDPLLGEAAALSAAEVPVSEDTAREIDRFVHQTFKDIRRDGIDLRCEVVTGKPAAEILRVSRERSCDLIVMSSHGLTGFRKMFFGSTTERVLRETSVPVLVTPGADHGPSDVEDVPGAVRRVLVPVDFTAATAWQLRFARGLSEALDRPLLLVHVIEPVRTMVAAQSRLLHVDAERRARAETELDALVQTLPPSLKPEALVAYGEPAEEIAKIANDRDAGLIVMGLHSSPLTGPRMGSVTYRVLCLAPRLVLAIPPVPVSSGTVRADVECAIVPHARVAPS
jgi:nucleotide-binding universal stress UspA family protein